MGDSDSQVVAVKDDEFFMPAEWEPHAACILLYPHNPDTYYRLPQAQAEVLHLARTIASKGGEPVWLLCKTAEIAKALEKQQLPAPDNNNIVVGVCPSNDTWARDTAPTFLCSRNKNSNNTLVGLDWQFNAYGGPKDGCYWPCDDDQKIATNLCQQLPQIWTQLTGYSTTPPTVHCRSVPLILEGGSIHTNGRSTLLTTQECLLHPNRNPTLSQADIQKLLLEQTGSNHIIWLPHGLAYDDDTNGHVDNFCAYCRSHNVVLAWTDDAQHDPENYQRCRKAWAVLQQPQHGVHQIHKLYLPSPPLVYQANEVHPTDNDADDDDNNKHNNDQSSSTVDRTVGQRLAASYINFYIANKAVLVPQFGCHEYDRRALETLRPLFAPTREVVGVPSREILLGGGNLHCVTQQIPKP